MRGAGLVEGLDQEAEDGEEDEGEGRGERVAGRFGCDWSQFGPSGGSFSYGAGGGNRTLISGLGSPHYTT